MEVLIHEASNRQEINTNQRPTRCTVDLKFTSETKRKDIEESPHIKHKDDKESIDIIFENITYTVNLGFRKGIFLNKNIFLKQILLSIASWKVMFFALNFDAKKYLKNVTII